MPQSTRADLGRLAQDLRAFSALAREMLATAGRIMARLEQGLESPFQAGVDTAPQRPPGTVAAAHLATHARGTPSRIAADPELEAFLLARIHNRTFPQLAAEVRDAFPPDRRVGMSSIHRWWQKWKRANP